MDRKSFKAKCVEAMKAGRMALSKHVLFDHPERHIDPLEIYRCIEFGSVQGDPYPTIKGDWKGEFHRHAAGRGLIVVVALKLDIRAVVVTAIPDTERRRQ